MGLVLRKRFDALPWPGLVAYAATHSGVAAATSPVPVPKLSYEPFRRNPSPGISDAVIRGLGSAPRSRSAFTNSSRSSIVSRRWRAPPPPCRRLHRLSQMSTGPAAACSAVVPSIAPVRVGALVEQKPGERALADYDGIGAADGCRPQPCR